MNFDFLRKSQILNFRNWIWLLFQICIVSITQGKIITSKNSQLVSDVNNCIQKKICEYAEVENTQADIRIILYQSGQNHLAKCKDKYPLSKTLDIKFNIRSYNLNSKQLGYELTYQEGEDLKSLSSTNIPCDKLRINQCKPKTENIDTLKAVTQEPVEAVDQENVNCFDPAFKKKMLAIRSEDESTNDGEILNFAEAKYGYGFKTLKNGQCEKICKEGYLAYFDDEVARVSYRMSLFGLESDEKLTENQSLKCKKCPSGTIERSDKDGCFSRNTDVCDYKSELIKNDQAIHCLLKCADGFSKESEFEPCKPDTETEKKLLENFISTLQQFNSFIIPNDFKIGACDSKRTKEIVDSYIKINLVSAKAKRSSLDGINKNYDYELTSFGDYLSYSLNGECFLQRDAKTDYTKPHAELLKRLLDLGQVKQFKE